ncbi:retrovirus-related pol polyprotein from transposon TNT 1-94 [Tanacetum coccineum]
MIENDRLLDQIISQDIVNIVVNSLLDINTSINVNSSVAMNDSVNYVEMCNKCLELEAELIKQNNMVEKDEYNRLSKSFSKFEQHCISLELAMQLNKEIFQKSNTSVNQTEPSFDQLFELNNLKAKLQAKDTTIEKFKANVKHLNKTSTINNVKKDIDEIETINIELEHRAKEHAKSLVNKLNQKSVEMTELNAQLQEKNSSSTTEIRIKCRRPLLDSKLNINSEHICCVKCNSSMFDARHELCFLEFVFDMNTSSKSKSVKKTKKKEEWKPTGKVFTKIGYNWRLTGRTFTLVGNAYPLTRITTTNKVPVREPIPLEVISQESVVTKVYTRIPKVPKTNGSNSKPKITKSVISNKTKPGTSRGSNTLVALSSSSSVDLRKYHNFKGFYVEGLGHNLFPVGQLCDSDLEVAFRKHTCFVCNLEGDDLLLGPWETNLFYIINGGYDGIFSNLSLIQSLKDQILVMAQRLSHLNFGAINHLAKYGLVRGLPKLKFEKDHLCLACAIGKNKKQSHKTKSKDTNQEKLYLFHMDLCGPMRVTSINGKKYILVIVDDYSWFKWVKFLASKDKAPNFIII